MTIQAYTWLNSFFQNTNWKKKQKKEVRDQIRQ